MSRFDKQNGPPLPPVEMRTLIGPTGDEAFLMDPAGDVFPDLPADVYKSVFDLGCGCGRLARKMMLQKTAVERYIGVDSHSGMVRWCRDHLSTWNPSFHFEHLNAFSAGLNPKGLQHPGGLPLPAAEASASLIVAWSVFTHLTERQIPDYLKELSRILCDDGVVRSTWFLFDKADYPMLQDFQNCLYINDVDPTNAVIVDQEWLRQILDQRDLVIAHIIPPKIKGFQWVLDLRRARAGVRHVPFPDDTGDRGFARPPLMPSGASEIGM